MEVRKLTLQDTQQFCDLIVDMYSHLDNLEWFTPMPYDYENVSNILQKERFFVVGLFIKDKLMAISSFDYKCGKLLGKIDLPQDFDYDKTVEIGFSITHSSFKGNKSLQLLIDYLLIKAKIDGIKHIFSKVHIDNIASRKSFVNKGFVVYSDYTKEVDKNDFVALAKTDFFSPIAKPKAQDTLEKFKDQDNIIVKYNIITKNI